jgi:hypothetical protein
MGPLMMVPSHEIQVLGLLVVVLVLAVGLGISVGHRNEPFVEAAIVSTAGAAMLDSRCTVTSNTGNPHVMGVFSGLMRHPMIPDACYFRTVTGNGRIVATDECLAGSEIHEPAVTNDIKNESVLGARRCVVRLKPGLAPSAYAAYDNALHEKAVERTDRFNKVVADIVVKKGAMINMGADRNATTGSLVSSIQSRQNVHGNLMTNYGDLEALIRDATSKATTITGQASTAAATLASSKDWQSRAAVRSSEAASKRIELSSAQADAAPGRESQRTQERNNRKNTLASVNTDSALSINTSLVSSQADTVCAAKAAADKAVADKITADTNVQVASNQAIQVDANHVADLGAFGMAPWYGAASFVDPSARWIWSRSDAASWVPLGGCIAFSSVFVVQASEKTATLHVIVDNFSVVYLNGKKVGTADGGWGGPDYPKIANLPLVPYADNNITIAATNVGGPAGIIAALIATQGGRVLARTNSSWTWKNSCPQTAVARNNSYGPATNYGTFFPPVMSDYTVNPGDGQVYTARGSTDRIMGQLGAWRPFNGLTSGNPYDKWQSTDACYDGSYNAIWSAAFDDGYNDTSYPGQWVQIQMPFPFVATRYELAGDMLDHRLYASSSSHGWTVLDGEIRSSPSYSTINSFAVNSGQAYTKFVIKIKRSLGIAGWGRASMMWFRLFGRYSD